MGVSKWEEKIPRFSPISLCLENLRLTTLTLLTPFLCDFKNRIKNYIYDIQCNFTFNCITIECVFFQYILLESIEIVFDEYWRNVFLKIPFREMKQKRMRASDKNESETKYRLFSHLQVVEKTIRDGIVFEYSKL